VIFLVFYTVLCFVIEMTLICWSEIRLSKKGFQLVVFSFLYWGRKGAGSSDGFGVYNRFVFFNNQKRSRTSIVVVDRLSKAKRQISNRRLIKKNVAEEAFYASVRCCVRTVTASWTFSWSRPGLLLVSSIAKSSEFSISRSMPVILPQSSG